uniref:Uncharacterized protein n=1 Tax=uncultured marine virus TaxID=186617 RepID=A0A0F7LC73_9VIRU|nr:hypothetical protein [uncultured marine virus]
MDCTHLSRASDRLQHGMYLLCILVSYLVLQMSSSVKLLIYSLYISIYHGSNY